jgi:hypothetical protein
VYLVSKSSNVTAEHYSVGANRIARIAHFATAGFFEDPLTPEAVAAHIDQIRDTTKGTIVTSGTEELQSYMTAVPM